MVPQEDNGPIYMHAYLFTRDKDLKYIHVYSSK